MVYVRGVEAIGAVVWAVIACTLLAVVIEGGKLFGSVTSKEVAEALGKQLGVEIDKRKIAMDGDIKAFGTYEAQVRLYTGITADIYVLVGE